ncbi:hypothetical protein TOPH_01615 [Tolypocladium ophioglossoides CBS 100239]|uniref:PH domain-containing protein n=1 Tax=Tolypocladium ophioglossoides (strain CBS 100239) TaxID=1163406 RepID=A0A0L0NJT2_TOLOC|nr:hypothetical protein TOPH_01615 [Tolypocladium ophioglossoides CBS 100239]
MASELALVAPVPPPLPPTISRYRSLRGKSVSSLRPFDIFRDSSSDEESRSSGGSSGGSSSQGRPDSGSFRRRSKSVANLPRRGPLSVTAAAAAAAAADAPTAPPRSGTRHLLPDQAPPLPTYVLSPRPANFAVKPNLEGLNSPTLRVKGTLPKTNERTVGSSEQEPAQPQHPRREAPAPSTTATTREDEDEHAARLADEVARLEAETDRILAEQKKLDLARLQAQLVTPPPKPKRSLLNLDKLAFLSVSRGRRSNANSNASSSQPGTPSTLAPSIFSPSIFSPTLSHFSRNSSVDESPLPISMSFIQPGGKGIVPQIDAPTSAINGGDRRVIVRCLSSTITLPVTAETSPVDVLHASAEMTKHDISPATCVVLECYSVLGLERRLRRYERLRDILNSWDNDQQNSLLILSCDTAKDDQDLDLGNVPRTEDPPPGFCVQLHHSSRPGKWNKRWVTLLDSGQMFASKRPDAGPSDKDSTVVCHLSDFDIYAPKESEMRRNLKPPKKHCYAIKSQQKTIVFPNGENFIHFFCTDDDKLAARFYELVHGWRSWYLVNRMVDLARKDKAPQIKFSPLVGRATSKRSGKDGNNGMRVSIGEAGYHSGEPLMDVSGFKAPDMSKMSPIKRTLTKQSVRESPQSKALANAQESSPAVPETPKDCEFSANGLLGEAYDKRKQAEPSNAQAQAPGDKVDGPFTKGPSLLNGRVATPPDLADKDKPDAKSWFPSATEHTARIRGQSIHHQRRPMTADAAGQARRDRQPAPLLNLNKDFPEPPPRLRDVSGGSGNRHPGGQPLIDFATGGQGQQPRHGPPQQAISRRGHPASGAGAPLSPHWQQSMRSRSRSTASSSQAGGGRRFGQEEHPPLPPLPSRSVRRDRHLEPSRGGPAPRYAEPLVNRARYTGGRRLCVIFFSYILCMLVPGYMSLSDTLCLQVCAIQTGYFRVGSGDNGFRLMTDIWVSHLGPYLGNHLLGSLENLVEEDGKNLLLEALALVNLADHGADLAGALLLEGLVALLEAHVVVELLDDGLLGVVLLAVVVLEDLALVGSGDLEGLVDEPGALVVLDVGADLANVLGQAKVVEEVVLDLEVLAEGDEDVLGLLEVLGGGEVELVEGEGDGLIDDDELVFLHGEVVEIDRVLGGGEQVAELAHLGLEGGLEEELDEVDVGGVGAEELLEEDVDGRLEDEGVVDGDHADAVLAVPAGLAAAGDAAVHDVVRDEKEGLEQLRHPTERGGLEVLLVVEGGAEEEGDGVGDGHAAVAFAAEGVDLELASIANVRAGGRLDYPLQPVELRLGQLVRLGMVEDGLFQLGVDGLELLEGRLFGHVGDGSGAIGLLGDEERVDKRSKSRDDFLGRRSEEDEER